MDSKIFPLLILFHLRVEGAEQALLLANANLILYYAHVPDIQINKKYKLYSVHLYFFKRIIYIILAHTILCVLP